ncbi:MAG TPA: response regulator SirA [Spirochaetes bacterium]|nr:response regulator SirA [Spirochaetota bacterium]
MIDKIIKRDGRAVPFEKEKIIMAVLTAAIAVGGRDKQTAEKVTDDVLARLEPREHPESYPTVEEVQDIVEKSLIERGHARTAKAFIIYRYEHALKREGKESLTYSSENIPYKKLWLALSWGVDNECVLLSHIKKIIEEGRFGELVRVSEEFYQGELNNATRAIMERINELKIIIVSGPSSSGKTTTTTKVGDYLKKQGYSLVTLNVDNYYFDLKDQPQDTNGDYDYETPQAIDLELLSRHMRDLLNGETVRIPYYNFKTGNREGISRELSLGEKDILLIDSLHGMFEEMTGGIDEQKKIKLYIETLSQLKDTNGRFVRWADIRMMRRMVRDMQYRNYSPRQTLTHWHYVRRSELRYIISRISQADVIVNSFFPYELPIMKHRLGQYFPGFYDEFKDDIDRDDAFQRSRRVQEIFREIPAWADESLVPDDSLLREFLGGSCYSY